MIKDVIGGMAVKKGEVTEEVDERKKKSYSLCQYHSTESRTQEKGRDDKCLQGIASFPFPFPSLSLPAYPSRSNHKSQIKPMSKHSLKTKYSLLQVHVLPPH
jgi:hypothetical protein